MKVLKKMKAAKGSSTSGNITAVVITVIFFIVIVLQGVCSRGGILVSSPEPSVAANKGLINMQFYSKPPANEINGPVYRYPNFHEAPSRSHPQMEDGRGVQ